MNGTATQQFNVWRLCSVDRPDTMVGMIQGFGSRTREQLEAITPEALGFYVDDSLMQSRGEERHTEQFVLQGGTSLDGPWVDIKPIAPLPGSDMSEPDYGNCTECGRALESSEYAIGDICDGCRPAYMEAWESDQEASAEAAAERQRYPEESDDDYEEDERY